MTMPDAAPTLVLTDMPGIEAQTAIGGGLSDYNAGQAGYRDARALAVFVCDRDTQQPIGGLLGRTSMGLLFIDRFFLPESLRKKGLGGRLIKMAEEEGASCSRCIFRRPVFICARATRCLAVSTWIRRATPGSS
jgi:acetyltransferase (GNAT) family protein